MSKEAAIAFLKKVAEDPGLQKKIVELARAEGYQFDVEEMTEDELGNVTGGLLSTYYKINTLSQDSLKLSSSTLDSTYKLTGF